MVYQTEHGVEDTVWYIGPDFIAKTGIVTVVNVQEQKVGAEKVTYVQYMIDGQYMQEGRVFGSLDKLVEHVSGVSK